MRPSPPRPTTAPTLISDTVLTVASRSPATMPGRASGSSTPVNRRSGRKPIPSAARSTGSGTARMPSTMFRTRITSVYSVIATTIGLSFVKPSHGDSSTNSVSAGMA